MSRSTSTYGVVSQVRRSSAVVVGLAERGQLVRVHQLEHRVELVVARRPQGHAGTSSSSTSGRPERSGSSRSGSASAVCANESAPPRLIHTVFSPSAFAGATSWKALAPTWTWRSFAAVVGLEEPLPVAGLRLVRAHVLGRDDQVERHAEPLLRLDHQRMVDVGEDREAPAAPAQLLERLRHLRVRRPVRQRLRERAALALGDPVARPRSPAARASARAPRCRCGSPRPGSPARARGSGAAASAPARRRRAARARRRCPCSSRSACRSSRTWPSATWPGAYCWAVLVRPLDPDDYPAVAAVFAEGIATGLRDVRDGASRPGRNGTRRHLPEHRFVAELDGEVVGWVAVVPYSRRAVYRGVGEESVYVAERARGRGVGRALLEAVIESAREGGLWTLQAGIFPDNRRLARAAPTRSASARSASASGSAGSTASGATSSCSSCASSSNSLLQGVTGGAGVPLRLPVRDCLLARRWGRYSSCLRKTTHALWPPKPNEFETPTWISDSRASFGM